MENAGRRIRHILIPIFKSNHSQLFQHIQIMKYKNIVVKKPMMPAGLMFLAGIITGIREMPPGLRGLSLAAAGMAAILLLYGSSGVPPDRGKPLSGDRIPGERILYLILCLSLFLLEFLRANTVSHLYHTPSAEAFFALYQPTNPGQFNYAMYLKSQGVYSAKTLAVLKEGNAGAGPLVQVLMRLRHFLESILDGCLSAEDAGLWKAILLGNKENLDPELQKLYQTAGISHLLAVSGLHVSMTGMGVYKVLRKMLCPKKTAAVLSSLLVFCYMIMTGSPGSAVRASVMLFLAFAAIGESRRYCMSSALAVSLLVLLAWRPYQVFQAGFQLSFGAVAGIAILAPSVTNTAERKLEQKERRRQMLREMKAGSMEMIPGAGEKRDRHLRTGTVRMIHKRNRLPGAARLFILSASIQLLTLPVIAWHYFVFPPYGILLNFLVIPLMTAVVGSGFGVLIAGSLQASGFLLRPLERVLLNLAAAPGHYVFALYRALCEGSGRLPFGSICIGRPKLWQIVLYYLLLAAAVHRLAISGQDPMAEYPVPGKRSALRQQTETGERWRNRGRPAANRPEYALLLFFAAMPLLSCTLRQLPVMHPEITMIDVGQGDGFLVRHRGHAFLLDGGSTSNEKLGERVLEPLLLSKGVTGLDACLVSHADKDHTSGIEYLMQHPERFRIRALVLPAAAADNSRYDSLRRLAEESTVRGIIPGKKENAAYGARKEGGASVLYLKNEDKIWSEKGLEILCLYEGNAEVPENANRHSPALLLRYKEFSMLFTGDMAAEDEPELCQRYRAYLKKTEEDIPKSKGSRNEGPQTLEPEGGDFRLSVLKVAHHGSAGSTTEELLDTLQPRAALISAGRRNVYGHPAPETLQRLEDHDVKVIRTPVSGAVELVPRAGKTIYKEWSRLTQ